MKPKVLIYDIETAPMLGYVWKLWDNDVALNQLKSDWYVLSWAAKWLDDSPKKIMSMSQRSAKNIEDDRKLLKGIWKLLDKADIVVTQNGKQFDERRLNARFVLNGMQPPSSYKHIDTKKIAQKHFGFTSYKLEYMTQKLCTKYTKLKTKKFIGFELWRECLAGNKAAWDEMERYNKYDVLSLEELYTKLRPWDSSINFSIYSDKLEHVCSCGSTKMQRNGFAYMSTGKYQRYKCASCGNEWRGKTNEFSKDKRKSLLRKVTR